LATNGLSGIGFQPVEGLVESITRAGAAAAALAAKVILDSGANADSGFRSV